MSEYLDAVAKYYHNILDNDIDKDCIRDTDNTIRHWLEETDRNITQMKRVIVRFS